MRKKDETRIEDGVFWDGQVTIEMDGKVVSRSHNLLVNGGRAMFASWLTALSTEGMQPISHTAVGNGTTAVTAYDIQLSKEIERAPIVSRSRVNTYASRYTTYFANATDYTSGNGIWNEVGLFDGSITNTLLTGATGTSGWSSDGTLGLDTGEYVFGTAALSCIMPSGTGSYALATGLNITATTHATSVSIAQAHLYITNIALLNTAGIRLYLYNDNAQTNGWYMNFPKSGLVTGWNYLSSGLIYVVGTPSVASAINAVKIVADTSGDTYLLNRIRLVRDSTTLIARSVLPSPITKTKSTQANVYWQLSILAGT
jgi:hypothetical protein